MESSPSARYHTRATPKVETITGAREALVRGGIAGRCRLVRKSNNDAGRQFR